MRNMLLDSVNGWEAAITEICIILGVVIAASLILYFVWDGIATMLGKKKSNETVMTSEEAVQPYAIVDQDSTAEVLEDIDLELAEAEKEELESQEETEEERETREQRESLERRRRELLARLRADEEEQEETEEEQEEKAEAMKIVEEIEEAEEPEDEQEVIEFPVAETVESEESQEAEEEVVEVEQDPQVDALKEERENLERERVKYEQMYKELEIAKAQLLEKMQEEAEVSTSPALTLDDLKARLVDAEERLKLNEKDLKACKKDFIPLNKVWRTHENDEKKLRRKEALVAKQKVVLYGVNNYADIDEEKAKKLAEDLDLLDGLKLSVQHCEEVMAKNQDRYPLLKRMYDLLTSQHERIKEEITTLQEEITRIESENDSTEGQGSSDAE